MSASADDDTFVLLVTIPIQEGREGEFLALLDKVRDEMRHEQTFINTIVSRSAEDPSLFILYETWRDRDAFFRVQRKRPYRVEYEAKLPGLLRAPRTMQIFEPLRADHAKGAIR